MSQTNPVNPARPVRMWKISPGRGHYQWKKNQWKKKSVIAIGWIYEGLVENLRRFTDIASLEQALRDAGDDSPGYAAKQCWTFCNEVKVDDIVVSYGRYTVLDIGRVEGEYYFKMDSLARNWELYGHRRKVSWFEVGPVMIKEVKIRKFLSQNKTIFEITDARALEFIYDLLQRTPEYSILERTQTEIRNIVGAKPEIVIDINKRRFRREVRRAKKRITRPSAPRKIDIDHELGRIRLKRPPRHIEHRGQVRVWQSVDMHAPTNLTRKNVSGEAVYLPPKTRIHDMDISLVREFRGFLHKIIGAMTNPDFAENVIQVSVEEPYRDAYRVGNVLMFNAAHYAGKKSMFYWLFTAAREVAYLIHGRRDERHMKIMRELVVRTMERLTPLSKASTHFVEVYGSLLNSEERKELLKHGIFREVGKIKRIGWKLSFDRFSKNRHEAVFNFVQTKDSNDVFYTTVFEVDEKVYEAMLKREMGNQTAEKWKRKEPIPDTSYRPVEIDGPFGKVEIFVIPEEGRQLTPTTHDAEYVQTVKRGIEQSYQGEMNEANLKALYRAVRESNRSG